MTWEVRQTRRFARSYKKLHDNLITDVNAAITQIAENPDCGVKKKGDLTELWVYKFHALRQL